MMYSELKDYEPGIIVPEEQEKHYNYLEIKMLQR